MIEFCIVMLISGITATVLTPVLRSVALRTGLVDFPDGRRKLQLAPIALGGGVAVFLSSLIGLVCLNFLPGLQVSIFDEANFQFFLGLFTASFVIVVIGLLDDRFHLRGRQKLLGQMLAAAILIVSGLIVKEIQIFNQRIELGLLSFPFTMFWLLGAINALNLIDGLDGLAGSVGVILSLAIAGMACLTSHEVDAIVAMALCGALLGFLVYNLPPASIYLGDAGSMLIGLQLGALAMRSSFKGPATVALLAPTVIWAIPILDVGMAILRRKLTGRSIYETDRGHLHHCLLRQGFSGRKTLLWIGILCSVTATGALVSVARHNEWLALASAVTVFGALVVSRVFGYSECVLLSVRLKSAFNSFIPHPENSLGSSSSPIHARLTGTRDWEDLWDTLTAYAERFDLSMVQLNVNLPALNEEYHVKWNRRKGDPEPQQWGTDIPLVVGGTIVGRLKIAGQFTGGSICSWMGDLIAGLKPFEVQMLALLSDHIEANLVHQIHAPEVANHVPEVSTKLVETNAF